MDTISDKDFWAVKEWNDDIVLVKTCDGCPEQYDAFIKSNLQKVGYLRLRHGWFRVDNELGDTLYSSAEPKGDGVFCDDEREYYLERAKFCIAANYLSRNL